MAAVALAGITTAGGGMLRATFDAAVYINGRVPVVVGTQVAGHGTGPHAASRVTQGSGKVLVGGKPLSRVGDLTSCAHPLSGGSGDVNCG